MHSTRLLNRPDDPFFSFLPCHNIEGGIEWNGGGSLPVWYGLDPSIYYDATKKESCNEGRS
jgi:hypothetical protein